MKKILSLVLVIVMVFALCIPAMAVDSPIATSKKVIRVTGVKGVAIGKTKDITIAEGETNTYAIAPIAEKKFTGYSFYKVDGSVVKAAVEGTDYVVLSKNTTTNEWVVEPLVDICIAGNYEGETVDTSLFITDTTSPKTGDNFVVLAIFAIVALAGVAFVSKKVLVK